jgi:hypothetical protein
VGTAPLGSTPDSKVSGSVVSLSGDAPYSEALAVLDTDSTPGR